MASKEKQRQSLHYINEWPQEFYAAKAPATITENNSPKQKKIKVCSNFVPNGM